MIKNGAVRYIMYDYLLIGHCKYSSVVSFSSYWTLNNASTVVWVTRRLGERRLGDMSFGQQFVGH